MKTVKQILETTYMPKGGDEKKFWDKHVRKLLDHPVAEPTQFKASTKKSTTNAANRDEASSEGVYEAAFNDTAVHTKRADKEPVIARSIDPKTRKGINVVKKAATGEIKIGEEVEELDELSKKTLGSYAKKASFDAAKHALKYGTQGEPESFRKAAKRLSGVEKAADKLTKEEVELDEGVDKLSNARLKFHATNNFPHGSYTRKEIQDEHKRRMKVEPNYHTVKPALSEELEEKVKNAYAVGMSAAMKATGDTPPLKKSTIVKGHEIAKSIKKEAMDPVGKADSDIDNDGDVDKSDKYLHNRRKAIGKALRKESVTEGAKESSEANHKKYIAGANKNKESFKEEAEQIDELSKKTLGSYVKKSSADAVEKRMKADRLNNAAWTGNKSNDEFNALDKASTKAYKSHHNRLMGINKATDRITKEEVEQIDELSPNTLHAYIKKAAPDVVGRTMSAVASNQSAETKKHASKLGNRIKGITGASGRLSDKANQYEEVDQIDELSKKTLGSYIKKSSERAVSKSNHAGEIEGRGDSNITPAARSTLNKLNRKTVNGLTGISRATNRLTKEDLDEAFKVGAMKLKDGSSVTLTKDCVESLNSLFNQLNPANKAKMEERLMSSPKGYSEILNFAENING